MKKLFGVILIVCGIVFAAYVGVWLCFVVGIVQVIEAIRAVTLVPVDVAIGILRVLCSGVAFALTAFCFIVPGFSLLASNRQKEIDKIFDALKKSLDNRG